MQFRDVLRSRRLWFAALAAGMIALAIGVSVGVRERASGVRVTTTQAAPSEYVDADVCVGCHEDEAEGYRKTGMGRSFSVVSGSPSSAVDVHEVSASGGANVVQQASGMRYSVVARNGTFFERRWDAGLDGKEADVMEQRIDYVVGSGNHARTYLHRARNGQLIELPVSWYSEGGGSWAMSPGYDWKGQKDFRRAITGDCMFCHNGYPEGDAGLESSVFPAKLPQGIDCQRCHGPGRAHAEAARSGKATPELLRSTIVNPARLDRERKLEVCMQCHLKTSDREPSEQRAFDRSTFSYRPGQPLADFKLYFEPAANHDPTNAGVHEPFEIAHAAYRLRMSACFRNSQMTCLTCHDPHSIPRGQNAVEPYTAVCLGCHRGVTHRVALPAASSCLTCHMPKRRTDDVVHASMTDHFIRRTQPGRDLLARMSETTPGEEGVNRATLYYPATLPSTAAAQISMAEAQVNDHGIERLQSLLERYQPGEAEPYVALAEAYEREGNHSEEARWLLRALAKRPDFRPAVVKLAPALFALHDDAQATHVLETAVVRYPADDVLLSDLGNAYLRQSEIGQAVAVLHRAVEANPERPETYELLGTAALKQGDKVTAERNFREALRCQPDLAEARDNLGSVLTEEGNFAEARFQFEKAIEVDAAFAEAHRHLGRLLVLMNQIPAAVAELRKAVRSEPGQPDAHEDLAETLAATGHAEEAMAEFEKVLALRADDLRAHLGLGLLLLSERRTAEARVHLQVAAASADADIAQTARHAMEP